MVTKYILFVQDPVGQFGANLAAKTLGRQTCIGCPRLPCVIPHVIALQAATFELRLNHFKFYTLYMRPDKVSVIKGGLQCEQQSM